MATRYPQHLDTLVHIGAGKGNDFPHYHHNAQQLILVEPSPAAVSSLRQICQGVANIHIHELAIGLGGGSTDFNLYNWPEANSLCLATGLQQLMPGLKIQDSIQVTTTTLPVLLQDMPHGNNLLIIDAPGAEHWIIEQLCHLNPEQAFQHIVLHCPNEAHYNSNTSSAPLLEVLEQQGYELRHTDRSDPDRPAFSLKRNALRLEHIALKADYKALQQQLVQAQQTITESDANYKAAKNQLQQLAQAKEQLTKQYDAVKQEHDQTQKKYISIAQKNEQMVQQQEQSHQQLVDIEKALKQAKQEQETTQQQFEAQKRDNENALTELKTQLDDQLKNIQKEKKDNELVTKERDILKEKEARLTDLQKKHAELQQRHQRLETENKETQLRQLRLESELLKAEAQIELIKDLMLNNTSF